MLESTERLGHLQSELSCLRQIHKDNMKEIAEKDFCITKLQANIQLLQQEAADSHDQVCAWISTPICVYSHVLPHVQ